eukprot:1150647-Pelagomonas_calceolata.AAC.2
MSSLVWSYAASQSPSHKPRPLVVFLSWMFAPPSVAAKYTQQAHSYLWHVPENAAHQQPGLGLCILPAKRGIHVGATLVSSQLTEGAG